MDTFKLKRTSRKYRYYCFWWTVWSEPFALWELLLHKRKVNYNYRPKSLCRFFWFCAVSTVVAPISMILFAIVFAVFAAVVIPGFWVWDKVEEWNGDRRFKKGLDPKVKGDHVVQSFLKAKKAKVCPLVELVD